MDVRAGTADPDTDVMGSRHPGVGVMVTVDYSDRHIILLLGGTVRVCAVYTPGHTPRPVSTPVHTPVRGRHTTPLELSPGVCATLRCILPQL